MSIWLTIATAALLLVKSEPEGANILIDGVSNGETPRLITHLDADIPHKVELRKAGYRNTEVKVRFNGRQPVMVNERLVLDAGVITVHSNPQGATVTVNGQERGVTPVTIENVPKGRSTIKLKLAGYKDVMEGITVNAGDHQTLNYELEGMPGTLALSSVPTGARFYVNNEAKGKGPLVLANLPSGTYQVRAEIDGYAPETRTVVLGSGGSRSEEFRLSNTMGRLEVRTQPAGAQIILDGNNLGATESRGVDEDYSIYFHIPNLAEGEHTLIVRKDGYAESVRHPKIKSGKTSQANVRLKRIFKPNVELVTVNGSYKGVLVRKGDSFVVVEIALGIERAFPTADIKQINYLDK